MSETTASAGTGDSDAARSAATPERTAPAMSAANADRSNPSAAWIAEALLLSTYGGAVVAKYTRSIVVASDTDRSAIRDASTPIDVASSSYEATARVPLPAPDP